MNDREYLQRVCQEPLKAWNNNHDWKGGDDDFIAWAIGPVHRSTDRWSACERAQADGAFISASRNEVPKMLAELADGWISVDQRLPDKWYSDVGDELIVFKPGFASLVFTAKWDNDYKLFFTGGYGVSPTTWDGITH